MASGTFTSRFKTVTTTGTLSDFLLASFYNSGAVAATITNNHNEVYSLAAGESVVLGNDRDKHSELTIVATGTTVKITYNLG
jgi:hypothetical protein